MTELLIIKDGVDYFRFTDNGYERCQMNKGSVFPLAKVAEAQAALQLVQMESGSAEIMKLTIAEENFIEPS
ncbi:MAG: hypothetical protein GY702_02435 [Desulfobulbaceae bacterium]|nr:hypothetical protein [Desulfobulbaceae bacterium]